MPTPVKIPAIIETIVQHTNSVKSFIMKPLKPCPNFRPGQFLHFAIDEYDPSFNWPESRVFSIANSPTRKDYLKITFSTKGVFTRRMFNEVQIGNRVWLKLPYGSFTFPEDNTEFIFIAGGTGVTPFISFLEYAIDKQLANNITLYYGVRTPAHIIFTKLLSECQKRLNQFQLQLFIEEGSAKESFDNTGKGKLPINQILNNAEITKDSLFYLSGPLQMIHIFKLAMMQRGITDERIKIDEWE